MSFDRVGRVWHTITLIVASGALILQLGVILSGQSILDNSIITAPLGEQVRRYFSFFTIQSNFLVAVSAGLIVFGRTNGRAFRVVRLAGLLGITVTGVVAAIALPPDPRYTAVNLLCDRLLHIVDPALTVVGWITFGPRRRLERSDILPTLAWPVLWLVATLGLAPVTRWYPYPFLNVDTRGWANVLVTCVGIAAVFVALSFGALAADKHLPQQPPLRRRG